MTAVSVFLIIMRIRKFQNDSLRIHNNDKAITPETTSSSSTRSSSVRESPLLRERNSSRNSSQPISAGFPQASEPFTLNEKGNERSFLKPSPISLEGDRSGVVFENSGEVPTSLRANNDGYVGESTPLLTLNKKEIQSDMPTADFRFGTLTSNTGLWHRDSSGKNLIRFVILLLFLVFSSFVVSAGKKIWKKAVAEMLGKV